MTDIKAIRFLPPTRGTVDAAHRSRHLVSIRTFWCRDGAARLFRGEARIRRRPPPKPPPLKAPPSEPSKDIRRRRDRDRSDAGKPLNQVRGASLKRGARLSFSLKLRVCRHELRSRQASRDPNAASAQRKRSIAASTCATRSRRPASSYRPWNATLKDELGEGKWLSNKVETALTRVRRSRSRCKNCRPSSWRSMTPWPRRSTSVIASSSSSSQSDAALRRSRAALRRRATRPCTIPLTGLGNLTRCSTITSASLYAVGAARLAARGDVHRLTGSERQRYARPRRGRSRAG